MGFSQASGTISRSNIDIARTTYYLNAGMLKVRGKMIAIMGGDNCMPKTNQSERSTAEEFPSGFSGPVGSVTAGAGCKIAELTYPIKAQHGRCQECHPDTLDPAHGCPSLDWSTVAICNSRSSAILQRGCVRHYFFRLTFSIDLFDFRGCIRS